MTFIYHRVPDNMTGNILYPLSELMEVHPELHALHKSRYMKRKQILTGGIPGLGCFWYDVLHFVAVHPQMIREVLQELGVSMSLRYYEIDAELIAPEKAVVYLNKEHEPGEDAVLASDFIPYNPKEVEALSYPSDDIKKYHKENFRNGDELMLHYHVPQILYRGHFDTGGLAIIEA